jgi:hypothetical protein
VAQSIANVAWPFAGRIFRTLGGARLDRVCVCRRMTGGIHLEPYMPDILPAKAKLWVDEYREAAQPYLPPFAPGELLGAVTAPQLTARDGLLLSDWVFLQDPWLMDRFSPPEDPPLTNDSSYPEDPRLAAYNLPDPWQCILGYRELGERLASLADRLRAGTATLSGLTWPLRPQPVEQAITAATLPMWTFDFATDFAALTTDPTVLLCDLRVIGASSEEIERQATAPREQTEPPRPPTAAGLQPLSAADQQVLNRLMTLPPPVGRSTAIDTAKELECGSHRFEHIWRDYFPAKRKRKGGRPSRS